MKISIVTPSYNTKAFIGKTIENVIAQDDDNVEHIIADGGSTDGTADILANYPDLRVDQRQDKGIYDGMNRGLSMATGDIVGILNADDLLAPNTLSHVRAHFSANPDTDILTGAVGYMHAEGQMDDTMDIAQRTPQGQPSYASLLFGIPVINARFFRPRVLEKIGLFDLQFPLAADRFWLIKAVQAGLVFNHTREILYLYRQHDGSSTLAGDKATRIKIWQEHYKAADNILTNKQILPKRLRSALLKWRALEGGKLLVANDQQAKINLILDLWKIDHYFPVNFMTGLKVWLQHRNRHSDFAK